MHCDNNLVNFTKASFLLSGLKLCMGMVSTHSIPKITQTHGTVWVVFLPVWNPCSKRTSINFALETVPAEKNEHSNVYVESISVKHTVYGVKG